MSEAPDNMYPSERIAYLERTAKEMAYLVEQMLRKLGGSFEVRNSDLLAHDTQSSFTIHHDLMADTRVYSLQVKRDL